VKYETNIGKSGMIKELLTNVSYVKVRVIVTAISIVFGVLLAAFLYKMGLSFKSISLHEGFLILSLIFTFISVVVANLFMFFMEEMCRGIHD